MLGLSLIKEKMVSSHFVYFPFRLLPLRLLPFRLLMFFAQNHQFDTKCQLFSWKYMQIGFISEET